jgi:hypothetical protein
MRFLKAQPGTSAYRHEHGDKDIGNRDEEHVQIEPHACAKD